MEILNSDVDSDFDIEPKQRAGTPNELIEAANRVFKFEF